MRQCSGRALTYIDPCNRESPGDFPSVRRGLYRRESPQTSTSQAHPPPNSLQASTTIQKTLTTLTCIDGPPNRPPVLCTSGRACETSRRSVVRTFKRQVRRSGPSFRSVDQPPAPHFHPTKMSLAVLAQHPIATETEPDALPNVITVWSSHHFLVPLSFHHLLARPLSSPPEDLHGVPWKGRVCAKMGMEAVSGVWRVGCSIRNLAGEGG